MICMALLISIGMTACGNNGNTEPISQVIDDGNVTSRETKTESSNAEGHAKPFAGNWRIEHFVDDFGGEVDSVFLQNNDYQIGMFSNSAVTNAKCFVFFFVEPDSVGIRLVEYGSKIFFWFYRFISFLSNVLP